RPGRAEAAAERVHADDEIAPRVDRSAGTDDLLPPAGRLVEHARCRVRGRGHAGEDKYRIAARSVELAPRLIGNRRLKQGAAPVHRKLARHGEVTACFGQEALQLEAQTEPECKTGRKRGTELLVMTIVRNRTSG